MEFIPDNDIPTSSTIHVPYFEDVRQKDAPGYRTSKSQQQLQLEIAALVGRLGGGNVSFQSGLFSIERRYGFTISFFVMSEDGRALQCRMQIAALPMRSETAEKKKQAMAQALFLFRDWLQGEVNAQIYRPGYAVFAPHLVLPSGKTLMEQISEHQQLASLPKGD